MEFKYPKLSSTPEIEYPTASDNEYTVLEREEPVLFSVSPKNNFVNNERMELITSDVKPNMNNENSPKATIKNTFCIKNAYTKPRSDKLLVKPARIPMCLTFFCLSKYAPTIKLNNRGRDIKPSLKPEIRGEPVYLSMIHIIIRLNAANPVLERPEFNKSNLKLFQPVFHHNFIHGTF